MSPSAPVLLDGLPVETYLVPYAFCPPLTPLEPNVVAVIVDAEIFNPDNVLLLGL